eukprot:scaffold1370_cov271-Pinguiococcus_pyrenoidosus.AAC.2
MEEISHAAKRNEHCRPLRSSAPRIRIPVATPVPVRVPVLLTAPVVVPVFPLIGSGFLASHPLLRLPVRVVRPIVVARVAGRAVEDAWAGAKALVQLPLESLADLVDMHEVAVASALADALVVLAAARLAELGHGRELRHQRTAVVVAPEQAL